jgi:flagellar biosynthetic protein FliO
MTPLRQALSAGVFAAALAATLPASAEESAPIGPPTAPPVVEAAPVVAPPVVAAPTRTAPTAAAKAAPGWLASKPQPKAAAGKPALPSMGRMVGLVMVLGALGGAALYLKRRGKPELDRSKAKQRLSVLSSTRIGPKAHAVVISVAGRQMLLGVTDSSVKRLAFIDELAEEHEEERAPVARTAPGAARMAATAAARAAAADPAQSRSFAELLKSSFKKREIVETDAASILAAETQDVVGGKPAPATSNVRMLDVEGQAQGLVRRLSGPRA